MTSALAFEEDALTEYAAPGGGSQSAASRGTVARRVRAIPCRREGGAWEFVCFVVWGECVNTRQRGSKQAHAKSLGRMTCLYSNSASWRGVRAPPNMTMGASYGILVTVLHARQRRQRTHFTFARARAATWGARTSQRFIAQRRRIFFLTKTRQDCVKWPAASLIGDAVNAHIKLKNEKNYGATGAHAPSYYAGAALAWLSLVR